MWPGPIGSSKSAWSRALNHGSGGTQYSLFLLSILVSKGQTLFRTLSAWLTVSDMAVCLYLSESHTGSGLWSYQFTSLSKPHFSLRFQWITCPCHMVMIYNDSGIEQCTRLRLNSVTTHFMRRMHSNYQSTFSHCPQRLNLCYHFIGPYQRSHQIRIQDVPLQGEFCPALPGQ